MTHLWIRAEQRPQEERIGIMPEGVAQLRAKGFRVTIEDSPQLAVPIDPYLRAGAVRADCAAWPGAPEDAIIFGLKELPEDGPPLRHRHIMFGHAFKGQPAGQDLLRRFRAGGGALYDLEYLTDDSGRRVAAFGYWAGFAGAAVSLLAYAAQARGGVCAPVARFADQTAMVAAVSQALAGLTPPRVLVIGALGRVGRGAADLCAAVGASVTAWDKAETATGGPFPEVLAHDVFLNCILAMPGTPVFVPAAAVTAPARLAGNRRYRLRPDIRFLSGQGLHTCNRLGAPRLAGAWRAGAGCDGDRQSAVIAAAGSVRRFRGAASAAFAGA